MPHPEICAHGMFQMTPNASKSKVSSFLPFELPQFRVQLQMNWIRVQCTLPEHNASCHLCTNIHTTGIQIHIQAFDSQKCTYLHPTPGWVRVTTPYTLHPALTLHSIKTHTFISYMDVHTSTRHDSKFQTISVLPANRLFDGAAISSNSNRIVQPDVTWSDNYSWPHV